jgi:hypothetical protein
MSRIMCVIQCLVYLVLGKLNGKGCPIVGCRVASIPASRISLGVLVRLVARMERKMQELLTETRII